MPLSWAWEVPELLAKKVKKVPKMSLSGGLSELPEKRHA